MINENSENKKPERTEKSLLYQTEQGGKFKEGNPGKPFGSLSIVTRIEGILEEIIEGGEEGKKTKIDALARSIVEMAMGKDKDMIKMITNYLDGMPRQRIGLDVEGFPKKIKVEIIESKNNGETTLNNKSDNSIQEKLGGIPEKDSSVGDK